MKGKRIGYIRVSTVDQNPERQLEGIQLDKKFIDYASGTTLNRPQFSLMLDYIREDDIVIVHSMDRLARNARHLREIVDKLTSQGIEVQFVKENLTFNGKDSPISNLLLMMMGAVAEFEHAILKERQREGIQIAIKKRLYKGRPDNLTFDMREGIKRELQKNNTKAYIAETLGISRGSLYNYMKKMGIPLKEKNNATTR